MNELKELLEKAHYECCKRSNISSFVLLQAYAGSSFAPQAISAAVNCFGDFHAPINRALILISNPEYDLAVAAMLRSRMKIPGWGSDFVKGKEDPIFSPLSNYLKDKHSTVFDILYHITTILHHEGKYIYPNAAVMTAAVGLILGYSIKTIYFLLIECRLRGWKDSIDLYDQKGEYLFIQG